MDYRQRMKDFEKAQKLEHEKRLGQMIQRDLADAAAKKQLSKGKQHSENLAFIEYMEKIQNDKRQVESQLNKPLVCKRYHYELEKKAAEERLKQKQYLHEMQKVCVHNSSKL